MKQPLTILTKKIKAVVIPNDILEKLDNPDFFELQEKNGKIILEPIKKQDSKEKVLIDTSLDLYST